MNNTTPSDTEIEDFVRTQKIRWEHSNMAWSIDDADLHPFIRAVLDRWCAGPGGRTTIAAECAGA